MIANRFVIAGVVRLVPLASLTTVTARVSNPIRAEQCVDKLVDTQKKRCVTQPYFVRMIALDASIPPMRQTKKKVRPLS